MDATPEEIELFENFKKFSENNLNVHQIDDKFKTSSGEITVLSLSAKGLIIKENLGNTIYRKRERFNEAVLAGGLEEWVSQENKKTEEAQEQKNAQKQLVTSNLALNGLTKKSLWISGTVAVLTLLALVVQIFSADKQNDKNNLLLKAIEDKNELLQKEHRQMATELQIYKDSMAIHIKTIETPKKTAKK